MGSLNRRAIFGAVPLMAIAPGIAMMATPSIDADLISMGERHARLVQQHEAACVAEDEADARFKATHIPKPVAFATQEDLDRGIGSRSLKVGDRIPWSEVERVNRNLRSGWSANVSMPHLVARAAWAEKYSKLMSDYRAAEDAVEKAVGLTDAGNHARRVYAELSEVEEAIVAASCKTLAGLAVKARVAKRLVPPIDDTDNDWHDTAALSVIDSLLKMGAH